MIFRRYCKVIVLYSIKLSAGKGFWTNLLGTKRLLIKDPRFKFKRSNYNIYYRTLFLNKLTNRDVTTFVEPVVLEGKWYIESAFRQIMPTITFYVNLRYGWRKFPFAPVPQLTESKSGTEIPCHQFRIHRPAASEILSHWITPLSSVIFIPKQEALVTVVVDLTSTLFSAIKKMDSFTAGSHTAFQKYFGTTVFTVGTV